MKKKTVALLLSVLLMLSVISIPPLQVSAAGQTTIKLKAGDLLSYGANFTWSTHMITAEGKMTYCINPQKKLPPDGTYSTDDSNLFEITPDNGNYELFRKALYYCYGGEGFRNSPYFPTDTTKHDQIKGSDNMCDFMWNLKYTNEDYLLLEPEDDNLYYLLTHRLLAFINADPDDDDWHYGLTIDWIEAIYDLYDAVKAAPMPPITTKLYLLDIGSSYQQVIIQRSGIKLELQKSSANEEISKNNACYSLADATYNIYLDSNCTDYFGNIVTDSDGYGQYNNGEIVPEQTYYVKEADPPKGYALDDTVYTFTDSGKTSEQDGVSTAIYSVACKDKPQNDPIVIALKKTDSKTGAAIANAEFTVKYYSGYYDTAAELTGKAAERTWVLKTDEYGSVSLTQSYLVSGDDFYYATDSGNPALPLGSVTIQETKAPKGYEINSELFLRKITSDGSAEAVITFDPPTVPEKQATKGKIKIDKRDSAATTKVLPDAVFSIYTSNATDKNGKLLDANKIDTIRTGADGVAISKDLEVGKYYVQEVTAPAGYELKKTVYTANVQEDNTAENPVYIKSYNDIKEGAIVIKKSSEDGIIEGMEFELRNWSTDALVASAKTDENGVAEFDEIPIGYYRISEVNTPERYVQPKASTVSVTEGKALRELTFVNNLKRGNIEGKKVDNHGADLSGATIGLFNADQTVYTAANAISTTKSKSDGSFSFTNVPYGSYKVREISAPTGYYLSAKTYAAEVTEDGQNINIGDIVNTEILGTVKVKKSSEDGIIEGMEFKLSGYSFGQLVVLTSKTDSNGVAEFKGLKLGNYTVTEINTPERYVQPVSKNVSVTAANAGAALTVKMKNEIKKGGLEISKTDIVSGTALKNAGYEVKDSTGKTVASGYTDSNGVAKFDNLPYGKYTYKEFAAPAGYAINSNEWPFEITENGQIVKAQATDGKVIMPDTGMGGTNLYTIAGLALCGAGAFMLVALKRRKKSKY